MSSSIGRVAVSKTVCCGFKSCLTCQNHRSIVVVYDFFYNLNVLNRELKMYNIENRLFIRQEKNGITVFDNVLCRYRFFESLNIEQLEQFSSVVEVDYFLEKHKELINKNIIFNSPLKVNWLIEESCNLDCIYCFANDKLNHKTAKKDVLATAKHITDLSILCVGLTGGEPTLNKFLPQIIDIFNSKCGICIDTNGTIPFSTDLLKKFKSSNALIRVTLDATDPNLLFFLRPEKVGIKDSLQKIVNNLELLKQYGINVLIETVITQKNIDKLEDVAKTLIMLGIDRWHMYGVNNCAKCRDIFDSLKVSNDEIRRVYEYLNLRFGKNIDISFTCDEKTNTANAVVLIDSEGNWFVDTMTNGIKRIGIDSKHPTLKELNETIDWKLHCFGYLKSKEEII